MARNTGKEEDGMKPTPTLLQILKSPPRALLVVMLTVAIIYGIYNENYVYSLMYLGLIGVIFINIDSMLFSIVVGIGFFALLTSCPRDASFLVEVFAYLALFVVLGGQFIYLIIKICQAGDKRILVEHLAGVITIYILLLFLALNAAIIQSIGIRAAVLIKESTLLRQVPASSGSFRYHNFGFGRFGCQYMRVIYDESDQISLPRNQRSSEWWKVSHYSEGAEQDGCVGPAEKITSHFFIVSAYCR